MAILGSNFKIINLIYSLRLKQKKRVIKVWHRHALPHAHQIVVQLVVTLLIAISYRLVAKHQIALNCHMASFYFLFFHSHSNNNVLKRKTTIYDAFEILRSISDNYLDNRLFI